MRAHAALTVTFFCFAALTAPLPYAAGKSGKTGYDKDTDLPRAVLFDVTNEAGAADTKAAAKFKAAQVQSPDRTKREPHPGSESEEPVIHQLEDVTHPKGGS